MKSRLALALLLWMLAALLVASACGWYRQWRVYAAEERAIRALRGQGAYVLVYQPESYLEKIMVVFFLPRPAFVWFFAPGADLTPATSLRGMSTLIVEDAMLRPCDLQTVSGATQLTHLTISRSRLPSNAWREIGNLQNLIQLVLEDLEVNYQGLRDIGRLVKVRDLRLRRCGVSDAAIEHIRQLPLDCLDLSGNPISDATLVHVKGFDQLWSLELEDTEITDAGVEHLQRLTQLRQLDVRRTKITDAALEHLKELTRLRQLRLGHTQITDAGLEHLKRLMWLRDLDLSHTSITDAGLEQLSRMTRMWNADGTLISGEGVPARFERLNLSETHVTDSGLRHLRGMTYLRWLDLSGTRVSPEAIAELRRALPLCDISH